LSSPALDGNLVSVALEDFDEVGVDLLGCAEFESGHFAHDGWVEVRGR
jgi:hypothetical protein